MVCQCFTAKKYFPYNEINTITKENQNKHSKHVTSHFGKVSMLMVRLIFLLKHISDSKNDKIHNVKFLKYKTLVFIGI